MWVKERMCVFHKLPMSQHQVIHAFLSLCFDQVGVDMFDFTWRDFRKVTWGLSLKNIHLVLNGQRVPIACSDGCGAVLDTGTSLLTAPWACWVGVYLVYFNRRKKWFLRANFGGFMEGCVALLVFCWKVSIRHWFIAILDEETPKSSQV